MLETEDKFITTIETLQRIARGNIVELPPFANGERFYARLRRPSLLGLVKSGKIPNTLLSAANSLFDRKPNDKKETNLAEVYDLMRCMSDAALLEPTLEQIEQAGVELSDNQMVAIFNYTQEGIKALDPFRSKRENTEPDHNSQSLEAATE